MLFKNKYLPLKDPNIDYETEGYLIKEIDFYLLNIGSMLADKINLIEKVIKKGYKENEAIEILGINLLKLERENLNRIRGNLSIGKGIDDEDVLILNRVYLKMKPNFNIFNIISNIIFNPIDLIPKK